MCHDIHHTHTCDHIRIINGPYAPGWRGGDRPMPKTGDGHASLVTPAKLNLAQRCQRQIYHIERWPWSSRVSNAHIAHPTQHGWATRILR